MKRITLLASLLYGLCSIAFAADVVVDGITYSLNAESHEASLTKGADRDTVIIPDFIEYEGMQYPVTSIGEKAFQRCSNLKAVTIGHNVRSIGISAFIRCKSLVEVTIPENVTVIGRDIFNHCEALERVSLCEGLTEIPTCAFYSCSSLKEINIPSTIQAIGGVAFSNCNALKKVEIADLRAFCDIQFDKSNISNPVKLAGGFYMDGKEVTELIIPEGVTTISSELFSSCKNITSLSLPASLETISSSAFKECSSLSQISIPESSVLKSIRDEAFSNCDSLKSIRLPESVQTIGAKAFRHCDNLKEINIPPLVTTLGEKCFELTSLSHVEFSSVSQACEIVYEESYNFNIPNSWHLYVDGEEVTDLTIPEGVTSLGRYQFSKCVSLRSVKIPSTMKSIGERAFSDCSSLERSEFASVESMCEMSNAFGNPLIQTHDLYIDGQLVTELVIPAGVKSIAPCAFKGSNIVSVVIGDDVETVGWDAFCECKQLEYVSIGKGMKSMEVAFESCPKFNKVEFPSLECLLNIGFTYTMTFGHETDKVHDNSNPLYYAHHLYIGGEEVHHLIIPEGTKKIYNFAFINCESIQSVIIPEGVTEIGKQVFAGCKNLTSIELPSTLGYANIGEFYDCPSLDYIKVHEDNPNMYSTKGNDALIVPYYNELTLGGVNAVIPDSVPYISGTAFNGRANLTSIRIPSSIKEIRGRAFAKCTSLSDIYYDTKALPKANNLIFDNTPIEHITLHVPADMVEAFKQANVWKDFGQIVALEPKLEDILADSLSGFSIYRWAMTDSTYMPEHFCEQLSTQNGERYALLMPNNEAFKFYVDAASFNTTTKKMVSMTWKDVVFPIRTQNYVYDFATATVGRRVSGHLSSLSYDATVDYLKMMRMSHTLLLTRPEDAEKGLLSGNRYFQALDGSVVKVLTDEAGNLKAFQGALQMQNEAAGLEAFNECKVESVMHKGSFDLYEIAQPVIHSPYSVQWVLQSGGEEDNPFAAFYDLTCADRQCLSDCGLTNITSLLPYLSSEGEDRLNYTDDKPFTLFVPTNEAIAQEIENGLPTWQSIRAYIDAHIISAPDGSFMWDREKNRLNAARQCLTLINFIKAHIMQGVEIADQLPFSRTHASALTKDGEAVMLEVKSNGGEQMTVSDGEHVCNVLDRKNIFTVDKVRYQPDDRPINYNTILVFSYHPGIIHQIDGVLNYAEGDMSQLPATSESLNYNDFAFSLFNEMQREANGENVVCSPLSAELAMGMQANGAAGNTLQEIQQVFGTAGHSLDEVNAYNAQLMQTMTRERTLTDFEKAMEFTKEHLPGIAFANGIWTSVPLYDSFIETNRTYYDAELQQNVNFGLQETMNDIDRWVSEKTRGTIQSINVMPNPDIASMLINALYFKGSWANPFYEYNTSYRSFTNADGQKVMVPMMNQDKEVQFAAFSSCKVVKLPYVGNYILGDKSDFSMTIYLPNEKMQNFQLTDVLWNEVQKKLKWGYVNLYLPRFKVDTETRLNNVLQSMGMHDAFDLNIADLSKMSSEPTYIDMIKQLCHVSVDEKGTEAASATIIIDETIGIHMSNNIYINRPFYFTIENNTTGTVLFVGKINQLEDTSDPTLENYSRFVKDGKVWKMGWFDDDSQEAHALEYHYIDGDTIVNGIRCKKMMCMEQTTESKEERYLGAVYEADSVVYAALAGHNQFYPIYDFISTHYKEINILNTNHNQIINIMMGGSMMRESEIYKGYCREAIPSDANNWVEWMLSVGYLGFFNFPDYDKTNGQLRLMECTHGDEVLYYDASLIDGVTPAEQQEARKNRLDFSHTIKSQPKVKALSHKVNEENETLSGEYSTKELFVNFLPLKGKYNVTLTDAGGKVVYAKQVQTDNVLALNTDIARYPAGTYTLTVENDNESYEASFTIEGTGVEPIHNAQCIIHNDGNTIYDLQGRRLNKESLPKGVYIVNGRKMLVK